MIKLRMGIKVKSISVAVLFFLTINANSQNIFSDSQWLFDKGNMEMIDIFINYFSPQNTYKKTDYFYDWMSSYIFILNKTDLRLLRNMVYAKHGYIFVSNDLQIFFSKFEWYFGTNTNVDELITENEWRFINFIKEMEDNYPDYVPNELIGHWNGNINVEDWLNIDNFWYRYDKELKFFPNGIFSYGYTNDNYEWINYWGLWSFKDKLLKLTFYFVGVEFGAPYHKEEYYLFDPKKHNNKNITNFNENIIFFNKNKNIWGEDIWECNFQINEKSYKKMIENTRYHPPE
jgi:hypothetical protein